MAPRPLETFEQFKKRLRAAAKRGETQVRFGGHHHSYAACLEDGTWRVRRLVLDQAKADAYLAQHGTFMPEHAEMLSEPGPDFEFDGTLDEVLNGLAVIWPRVSSGS